MRPNKGEKMNDDQMVDELLTPKHVTIFEKDALRLARTVYLTSDWNEEKITSIKNMAKDLQPKPWFKEEF